MQWGSGIRKKKQMLSRDDIVAVRLAEVRHIFKSSQKNIYKRYVHLYTYSCKKRFIKICPNYNLMQSWLPLHLPFDSYGKVT